MKTRLLSNHRCHLYGGCLAVAVFVFDVQQPLGVASAVPYIGLPLLGMLARSKKSIVLFAFVGTLLTLAGALLSAPGAIPYVAVLNRGLCIALIVAVAYVAVRHLKLGDELRESLEHAALRDALTGLYNRHHVFNVLESELNRYKRYGSNFSVVLIDADHFKQVNDEYGHNAGDEALRAIAHACNHAVRDTDVVGRYGGEEFIILLPHAAAAEAEVVAERLRRTLRQTAIVWQDQPLNVTLSMGVAEAGPGTDSVNSLLTAADEALYTAKRGGRDRITVAAATRGEFAAHSAA